MPIRDTILPLTSSKTLWLVTKCAAVMGVYSSLPLLIEISKYRNLIDMPSDMHAAFSMILGCLLVFRMNTAYSRWWEARTLWGILTNATRNLGVKLNALMTLSPDDTQFLTERLVCFPRCLRDHLRAPASENQISMQSTLVHVPLKLVQELYAWLGNQRRDQKIGGDELRVVDQELAKLLECCGACERIARTPVVRSYQIFARQCVFLFLLTLPWGVAKDFQFWTIPITMMVSYFMIGLEIVAEHVEEPFGLDEDDLDLDGMCDTLERSVRQVFTRVHVKV